MPQISLYIDKNTIKKIEYAAKLENKSDSQWISSKIKSSLENSWPEGWFNLFGSLKDDSFKEPSDLKFNNQKDISTNELKR